MEAAYEYSPYIWVILSALVFPIALVFHAWRNRSVPGAVLFLVLLGIVIPWIIGNGLELLATGDESRIFWYKFQAVLFLLMVTAVLCFVLEYSGLGKWLNRPGFAALAVPVLAYFLLVATNNYHNLIWKEIRVDDFIHAVHGPGNWAVIGYGGVLSLLQIIVLVRLFVRSPRHRWIAGWLILAPFITRAGYFLNITDWNPFAPVNPTVIALNVVVVPYAFAVFRFRMFDVVAVARDTVFEKMHDGMMVLDARNRIVDLNDAVQRLFGIVRSRVVGGRVEEVLEGCTDLVGILDGSAGTRGELCFENEGVCWIQVSVSPVIDNYRNIQLGRLIWFHDITEEKLARTQVLNQQMTLAVLKERELLARELHDGVGQLLAAADLHVRSAIELLARRDFTAAGSCLGRLADVTREAKKSIRTYLIGVKTASHGGSDFVSSLRRHLENFSRDYGIAAVLTVAPEMEGVRFDAGVEAQLHPIIQEALTNARRHGGSCSARVVIASLDGYVQVTIEDDGRGFNPEEAAENQGFGLRSMRGRAESIGAFLEVDSAPGNGTRVIVRVPLERRHNESAAGG
ncbi:MAG TPA: PAS domain S-box protein [Desulfobacteraceae bacterium]|nr:PAS domain S-box protein [Desulfobacteraceae bacterium]